MNGKVSFCWRTSAFVDTIDTPIWLVESHPKWYFMAGIVWSQNVRSFLTRGLPFRRRLCMKSITGALQVVKLWGPPHCEANMKPSNLPRCPSGAAEHACGLKGKTHRPPTWSLHDPSKMGPFDPFLLGHDPIFKGSWRLQVKYPSLKRKTHRPPAWSLYDPSKMVGHDPNLSFG